MTSQPLIPDKQVDVLIVGAGPAGLSAALSLHHFSYRAQVNSRNPSSNPREPKILLVDALTHGQNESRALIIHARTLEALRSIDCTSSLLPLGIQTRGINIQRASSKGPGSKLLAVDFSSLKGLTEFPFGLLIPQHMTERALGDILKERARETLSNGNLRFLRGLKMAGMKEEERMVEGTLQKGFLVSFEGGQNVWSRYLVGADGAKSMVRNTAHIPFEDPQPKKSPFFRISRFLFNHKLIQNLCLADIVFDEDLTKTHKGLHKGLFVNFGTEGFFLFSPIKLVHSDRERLFREVEKGDDGAVKYWYRIAFSTSDEEFVVAKAVLHGSKPTSNGASNGTAANGAPAHRDTYQSSSEGLEYLQKKLETSFRYVPSGNDSDDLPINPSAAFPRISKLVWASTFRIRNAVADTFHKSFTASDLTSTGDVGGHSKSGHVLLIGDAGHIHSPAGGQGMNIGIRDGIKCGKAIAEHIFSITGSDTPLEKFATAERNAALETINFTKTLTWLASMPSGSMAEKMRNTFMKFMGMSTSARKKFALAVSGLDKGEE